MLTPERLRELLHYEPETGAFVWRASKGSRSSGSIAGTLHSTERPCFKIRIDRVSYFASRLAWAYIHGEWPTNEIDHIDGDPTNNRQANLREATRTENAHNVSRANRNNRLGSRGISWNKAAKKWVARIRLAGKSKYLGHFERQEHAKEFRDLAAAMLRPFSPEARA